MTASEAISNRLLENITEDREFIDEFCKGCPLIIREYGYNFCPVDYTPSDRDCYRRIDWQDIEASVEKIADTAVSDKGEMECHY